MMRAAAPRPPRHGSPQRAPWGWAAAGLGLGLVLALLAWAPAQWLASGVQRASGGQVQLHAARGLLWQGSAQLVLTGGAGSQDRVALPGRLHWRLRPAWRGARLQLSADCCTPEGPLQVLARAGWNSLQLQLRDGTSQWPAGALAGLGTPWNTVQLQGRLQLSTEGLQLSWSAGRLQVQGRARLDALAISSRLSTLRPLGSYRLALQGGDAPTLQLSTLEGALQLSGSGRWVGQRLRFEGEAAAAPGREAVLANLLNIIGRRQGARSIITL
ncbi:general secretion pathway protein N [Melaminivora alkalimesophila]|uniref:Type II secretion system protein N n=2 Tax=Melaminivora alkalimesophila TaxID=1165852 RepID=A0A317R8T4_9BURK|nr:type II secretion system protein N [Melaminivora alkalimesophila]PWW43663.1 general secretion pathway protein N [Melaminivora alkalimesophila]